ncbi:hypothetical protein PRVXT_000611 [Proteinivorax tanatarense]|uniref:ABC transporter permease n=1 Tax=Proteinivorax tanatarense TaxID=1260629 RepID=A0AAU7VNZ7_9FIRM
MESNSFERFLVLYKKDIKNLKQESMLLLGFILLAYIFVVYKITITQDERFWVQVGDILFLIVVFMIFIRSFVFIASEWNNNTVFLVKPLPIRGKEFLLAKTMAVSTQAIFLGGICLGFMFLIWHFIVDIEPFYAAYERKIWIILFDFIKLINLFTIVFFSSVVGQLFKRHSQLITIFVFVITLYLIVLLDSAFAQLLGCDYYSLSLPNTYLFLIRTSNSWLSFLFNASFTLMYTIFFFMGAASLYDKKVEEVKND